MTDLNCKSHQNQEDAICEIESDQDTSRNSTAVNYQDKLLLIQNLAITKTVRINKAASHKELATSMKNALVSIETKMEKQEDAKLKQLPSLFQEDTITIPKSLHNSKRHTKDIMTQTLPTIPELDVVSDKQYGASFDYIKEGDNRFSSAKGEKQNTVKHVIFDDQESIETRFNIQDVNSKQSTHTIKHKRTPSFISFDDMIHSTKHMEQSNKASYVKKAVGTTATTTHSVEDTAEQAQYPISTVKERVAQWQGGVEREAADIATKTRNGKDAVGIDDSHREILTTNAAPKTESENLEFNTKITFEEQELEPVIRKKLLNKVAQHKFNQDIYDASIISYKILHNYEDLVWLMKKFDIHHPLMDDGIDLLEKDPFYLK